MIDARWQRARKILLVRLDNLGDVLLTTPAFRAVKRALPGVSLTLLASPVGAQVDILDPDIAEVIPYQAPWVDPWWTLPQESAREQQMIVQLKAEHFDAAIIFTSFRQSPLPAAYLCYLADIPLRLVSPPMVVAAAADLLASAQKDIELVEEVAR
jgi:ADP-heptose:LPS heptosyltransferase